MSKDWFAENAPADTADWFSTNAPAENTRIGSAPSVNRNLEWAQAGVNAIPAVGGLVGGAIADIPGAAIGGAGGAGLRQAIIRQFPRLGMEAPATPLASAKDALTQGSIQGVSQAGGKLLGAGLRMVGRGAMRAALRPTPTLKGEFPNIIETALGEGRIPVRDAMRGGLKAMMETNRSRLRYLGKEMDSALDRALKAGNWYSPEEFLATVRKELAVSVKSNPLRERYIKRLRSMLNDYKRGWSGPVIGATQPSVVLDASGNPAITGTPARKMFRGGEPLSPRQVRRLKRSAQRAAAPVYSARARGMDPGAERSLEGEFQSAIAKDARAALSGLPTEFRGKNVAELDEMMKDLIGLRRAGLQADRRYYASGLPFISPALNWVIPASARSPNTLYPLALLATEPKTQFVARQLPRFLEEMLVERTRGVPFFEQYAPDSSSNGR